MNIATISPNDAGPSPAPREALQQAGIAPDRLGVALDALLALEELLSNSSFEVQPERLAALLRLVNDELVRVVRSGTGKANGKS